MQSVDEYIAKVIGGGDAASSRLAKIFAPTLKNSDKVRIVSEGMNGLSVFHLPSDSYGLAFSVGGDPKEEENINAYAESAVDKLIEGCRVVGATPIAFTNVIDAKTEDLRVIDRVGNTLAEMANHYGLAVPNGELAILGDRMIAEANVSLTVLASVPKADVIAAGFKGQFSYNGINYAVFDHQDKPLYMNNDGVGTKTEFAERSERFTLPLRDSAAMKLDDLVKLGARALVLSDVVETTENFNVTIKKMIEEARKIGEEFGFNYIIQHEDVGRRIRSYKSFLPAINISGGAISTIDEDRLASPLTPSSTDVLIAIRGKPNPRSNGITDKRKVMVEMFGDYWDTTVKGKEFMNFLGEPSTIFYGLFSSLINTKRASGVYHMSGGAFNGKLAKPLAKHGLYVKVRDLFEPDWREVAIAKHRNTPNEAAYAKWPMGNEGFVTTRYAESTLKVIREHDLEGRVVGRLEEAKNGRTGVELVGIEDSKGNNVYYSGKEEKK